MADHREAKNLSDDEFEELLHSLPKERGWSTFPQYQYQGCWYARAATLQATIAFHNHFKARDSDVVVCSLPKCGTTWLKALTYAVVNRHRFESTQAHHPLLTTNSQNLVQTLEIELYRNNQVPDFSGMFPDDTKRRLFATHLPFPSLGRIAESNCKIVYVCRNPFDTFVSYWHFINKIRQQQYSVDAIPLDEAFDRYCRGTQSYGPFWDHILGYWNESLKISDRVLFFKYEDMKIDVVSHLKALAEFIDLPFTEEEERKGVIQEIARLCSFETMKNLEVNKTGTFSRNVNKEFLFRKAEVGDWVNYLTPTMEDRMSKLIEEKFGGSGLTFKVTPELAAGIAN